MKKIMTTVLATALLASTAVTLSAEEIIKRVPKQQNQSKTLESRVKATQEREARKLQREKQRKLEQQAYERKKAERKRKIEADRKAAKAHSVKM